MSGNLRNKVTCHGTHIPRHFNTKILLGCSCFAFACGMESADRSLSGDVGATCVCCGQRAGDIDRFSPTQQTLRWAKYKLNSLTQKRDPSGAECYPCEAGTSNQYVDGLETMTIV